MREAAVDAVTSKLDEAAGGHLSTAIVIEAPDEMIDRVRRGAVAARKPLDQFVIERLQEAMPPSAADLPAPVRDEMNRLEQLDDDALWEIARAGLAPARQRRYDRLLHEQARSGLSASQQAELRRLGDEARGLTLLKAHALLLLKWRGQTLPAPDRLLPAR